MVLKKRWLGQDKPKKDDVGGLKRKLAELQKEEKELRQQLRSLGRRIRLVETQIRNA